MKLKELSEILPLDSPSDGRISIRGISSDSRTVEPGFLFAALAGSNTDGARFAGDAAARGAAAILTSNDARIDVPGIPVLRVSDPHRVLSLTAARFFNEQPETIVAVTGTSGKTSVAAFTRQIWQRAGKAAASIGTTGVEAPGHSAYGALTTPDPVELHRLLRDLAGDGVTHAAMEASSHGLDQRRLDGVRLAAGAFTNLGRDHMDYHPTVDAYFKAKLRLFEELLPDGAPAVVYADNKWSGATTSAAAAAGCDVFTVGRTGRFITLKRVEHERHRQRAELVCDGSIHEVELPLAGDFQIANALVAAGLSIVTGTPAGTALGALELLQGAPGRLDLVGTTATGAPVYVDYAHKPDALENVLRAVRPFTTGRIIVVFGCGGDRDRGKRPIMGEIASRLSDVTIVTDDNPRSEGPGGDPGADPGRGSQRGRNRRPPRCHSSRGGDAARWRHAADCRQGTRSGPRPRARERCPFPTMKKRATP